MSPVPAQPRIYHITHVENLPGIIRDGGLWSDATLIARGGPASPIGMGNIKQRRLNLPIKCYFDECVGDYVPFYFCPRSVMLYILHRDNHPDLTYHGGQRPILHLEADLYEAMVWADANNCHWAFSLSNAGAVYTEFRNRRSQLNEIDWAAVGSTDFRESDVKEGKQAEFMVHKSFPWTLVRRIGVASQAIQTQVLKMLHQGAHRPLVEVRGEWYF